MYIVKYDVRISKLSFVVKVNLFFNYCKNLDHRKVRTVVSELGAIRNPRNESLARSAGVGRGNDGPTAVRLLYSITATRHNQPDRTDHSTTHSIVATVLSNKVQGQNSEDNNLSAQTYPNMDNIRHKPTY